MITSAYRQCSTGSTALNATDAGRHWADVNCCFAWSNAPSVYAYGNFRKTRNDRRLCRLMAATSSSPLSFQEPFPEHALHTVETLRDSSGIALASDAAAAAADAAEADGIRLMENYEDVIRAIISEVESMSSGELVILSIYVVEPGKSTDSLLQVLRKAAERGVRLNLQCDFSLTSHVTRVFEGTMTEAPALAAIAEEFPSTCSFTPQSIPTHAKYAIFRRVSGPDSAVFGGVNVGDRFADWRDFAVLLCSQRAVDQLVTSVMLPGGCTECDDVYLGLLAPNMPQKRNVAFCCNRPRAMSLVPWLVGGRFPGEFQVKPTLISLFSDPSIQRITMALAYIDSEGAAVIQLALDRGAEVRLVMPLRPNVYQSCNSRTLASLLEHSRLGAGSLELALHPEMLHAKSLVATREDSTTVGLIGSCNFKSRSFGQFTELCAMFTDPSFNCQLEASIEGLFSEAQGASSAADLPRFDPMVAAVEQWLG